jgi:exodeoxyribonuclease VII large subunit
VNPGGSDSKRPPFDPRRVRGEGAGSARSGAGGSLFEKRQDGDRDAPLTVSQFTRRVRDAIRAEVSGTVRVVGELSNVARPPGGHVYFTLKDEASEVRCVMWRSDARGLKFEMQDGLEVLASGSVDVYEPRGQYQLYVKRLEPRGVGALELAFRQLRDRLEKEGLFDPAKKKPLPRYPSRIALVTSASGAAVQDMLRTLHRRYPKLHILVRDVRVQGDGAAEQIAQAIRELNRRRDRLGGIDVMIVGRGGGSLEDLWAFNEEAVARAIAVSSIPIVSAVGHEVDFTIADFVADVRAATPTAAAEMVVPVLTELLDQLDALRRRLTKSVRQRVELSRSCLTSIERSPWFRDPTGQVQRRRQPIDELLGRLRLSLSRQLGKRRSAIQDAQMRLVRARPAVQLARRRERIALTIRRLSSAIGRLTLAFERGLSRREALLQTASPRHGIARRRAALMETARRLSVGLARTLERQVAVLDSLETRLGASSHTSVLGRGYSITRLATGSNWRSKRIIRGAEEVQEGDKLITETAHGEIASRVVDRRQRELFEE